MGEESKDSSFNEALLKMERIHKIQDYLNSLRLNLLAKNLETGQYNYECFIYGLISLLSEVKEKGSEKEKEFGVNYRDTILSYMETYKPYTSKKFRNVDGDNMKKIYSEENWKKLRDAIFKFEDYVRELVEEHGFSTPNVEAEAGWD